MAAGRAGIEDAFRLAPLQEGILYHCLESGDPDLYVGQYTCVLDGPLDADRLRRAWSTLVSRHPALRTAFAWERQKVPMQVVRPTVELPWREEDWRGLDADEVGRRWEALLEEIRAGGLSPKRAPLLRVALAREGDARHRLAICYHHLVLDGWSLRLLLDEAAALHGAPGDRQPTELPPTGRYGDFVEWLERRDWSAADAYWRRAIGDVASPTPLELPGTLPGDDTAQGTRTHGARTVVVPRDTVARVAALARACRVTASTVFSAAWALTLGRYSDRDDVLFGTAQAGRPPSLPRAASTVGLFINTLPTRVRLPAERAVGDWLRRIHDEQLEARDFEHMPLARIQRASSVPAGHPLFESLLVHQSVPEGEARAPWTVSEERYLEYGNYPLALLVRPGHELLVSAVHDRRRFSSLAVEAMLAHYESALGALTGDPARPLATVDALPGAERERLLNEWSGARACAGSSGCVHGLIDRAGARAPGAPALEQDEETVSHALLGERSSRLAASLAARGVGRGGFAAVFLERSPAALIAMLGALRAGAAYVPLDPHYPSARIAATLADLAGAARSAGTAAAVLTDRRLAVGLPQADLDTVLVDEAWTHGAAVRTRAGEPKPDDVAYVMYTSGSTGTPKGVMVTHRNIVSSNGARARFYPEAPDRFLMLSSLATDSSIAGIFWTLCAGGTLVLPRARQEQSLEDVVALIRDRGITHMLCLPALYGLILEHAAAPDLASLRCVVVAGEACPPEVVRAHRRLMPATALYNEYGPSEGTVWVTAARVDGGAERDLVPIGRPVASARVYVLGSDMRVTPAGLPGELYIGGPGVAAGYLGRPELTAERFVTDPFCDPGAQLYRTGDRVRFLADGALHFLGRVDDQVKVRGFRVEPGEIERALQGHEAVSEAAVVLAPRGNGPGAGDGRLVAYVVGGAADPTAADLRDFCHRRLPEHMVPHAFVTLEALPRTPGGKVDRRALRALAPEHPRGSAYRAPVTPEEITLAAIWKEVLGLARVGADDDFFEAGGDSLLSIRILARAHRAGLEISAADFFARPTVAEQARAATRHDARPSGEPAPSDAEAGDAPAPFALSGLDAKTLSAVARQLGAIDDDDRTG